MLTFIKKHYQKIMFLGLLIAMAILVYSPHFNYPYPLHVDEWKHISEAKRFNNPSEYFHFISLEDQRRFSGLEIGFHILLSMLGRIFDLVIIYRFLPAIWATGTLAAFLFLVYQKTSKNFWLTFLSGLFLIFIKSNVNITGLWFFTPLTFSLPFIFLYIYFFTEGLENQSKKHLLASFLIMLLVLPVHPISLLANILALIIYGLIHYQYLIKEYKFFSIFAGIFLAGLFFYKIILNVPFIELPKHLMQNLVFRHGWGVLELQNSFTELYGSIGYWLALAGIIFLFINREAKKYSFFLIWPATILLLIIIFRLTEISLLSPYQRNLYYLVIGLPFLSGYGLYHVLLNIRNFFTKEIYFLAVVITVITITTTWLWHEYYMIDDQVSLYYVINQNDYQTLKYLAELKEGIVLATPFFSTALYPISGHHPVGDLTFYGDRQAINNFFLNPDCEIKKEILLLHKANYFVLPFADNCELGKLIKKISSNHIYEFTP